MVVVGIPGVGKTTVVDKVNERMRGAETVTFGTVMLEEAVRLGWIKDRDQMRGLTIDRQRKIQRLAAAKIARMKGKIVFVDTHLFIRTPEGFWPGLPFEVVRALEPTHLILVEATPEEILRRRAVDGSRLRDDVQRPALESELSLQRSFLAVSSTLTGAPMLIVDNNDGEADEAAETIARVLKGAV